MGYQDCVVKFLSGFNNYVKRKYVLSDNAFIREGGKWVLDTAIKYPICSNKKTKFRDVNRFLKIQTGDINMNITGSGVCDRMKYIDPQAYRDMSNDLISAIYSSVDVPTFKGFTVAGIDSSIIDIPNRPETRKEMGIPEDTEFEKYSAVARLSCMIDGNSDFVLSSNLSNEFTDEITHALWHLNDVKKQDKPHTHHNHI